MRTQVDTVGREEWDLFEFSGACSGCGETPYIKLVEADGDRVGQVLTNFLTNALKYSPATSVVDVTVTVTTETVTTETVTTETDAEAEQRAWARVAVRDEGPGLPSEELSHAWERFHRVPGVEVQQGSGVGLGLGLYISRELMTRQGGRVGVESAVGAGATFWFSLPLSRQESYP